MACPYWVNGEPPRAESFWKCNPEEIRDLNVFDAYLTRPRGPLAARPDDPKQRCLTALFGLNLQLHPDLQWMLGLQLPPILTDGQNVCVLAEGFSIFKRPRSDYGDANGQSNTAAQAG